MTRSGMEVVGIELSSMAYTDIGVGLLILLSLCLFPFMLRDALRGAEEMDRQHARIEENIRRRKRELSND